MIKPVKLLSVISIILAILIFVEVPVGAVAPILENVTLSDNVTVNQYAEQDSDDNEEGVIISELEEKRTENTKTFRLSDGTNMVAQYNLPVHYKDRKGDWVDYDNSLQSTEQEITASGNAEATLDSVSTSELTNASTSVKTVKKQMYKNRKSNSNVAFAQESSEDNMVLIKNKKHAISWGYKGINPQRARYAKEKPTRTGNDRFTVLDNLTSTVEYKSAYKDVDIQCITTPVGVKENIILNKKSATNKFVTTYDIGELRAEKLNDREIALYNADNKIEYYINALYMFDANNETSEAIVLNILENANGKLAVELVADEQWLNATERAYPVTIDPSFTYDRKWGTVDSSYVDKTEDWVHSYDGTNITTASMYVGYNDRFLSLIKMNELPVLNKGDVIVGATLNMCTSNYDYYAPAYIGVYEATSSWSQETVKWSNKPGRGDSLLDYCDIYNTVSNGSAWVSWDITKLTKEWYNGTANNGVYLKMLSVGSAQCAGFYSSNYLSNSEIRPAFMLAYRNNKGVENYWSYTSFSVGNAGTAHINDYSGALTFELPIASTADPNMPAGVSYVYNSYMANIKYDKNAPYFGDGWRMNMQQTVLPSSNFGLKGDDAERYPYVYTDADGTDHYFQKVTEDGKTKYLDEDGLSLELKIDSESSGSRYIITDKDKNKWYFHKTGLLNRFQDPFSNKQQVTYDGTKITKISDSSNNSIQFSTNSSNYVTSIKDPSSRSTTFVYDSDKRVTTVTRPDGTSTAFSYYKNGLLKTVTDSDGYKVTFTYDDNDTKSVASVQEYGTNGAESSKITFDRTKYNETIIRTPGPNGEDRITTCQFDNCGRLTGAHSKTAGGSDMGAESFSYTSGTSNSSGSNIKTLNKVSKHHSLGQNAVNYLKNTNLESSADWTSSSIFGGATYSSSFVNTDKLFGQKSLKINVTSYTDDGGGRRYQDITNLTKGNYYTVSGYIKSTQISQLTESDSGAFVAATIYTADGSTHFFSEYITEKTDESINNGWRRVHATFKYPEDATKVRITLGLRGAVGTAYFDGVQVEYGKNTSSYNMVQNSSFESSSNHVPTYWSSYQNMDFGDHKDGIAQESHDGSKSFSIKGNVTLKKSLYQEIPVSGVEADTYILSGWAKTTTAIPVDDRNNRFRLSVHVVYNEKDSDGNNYVEVKNPPNFNTSITSWQFSSYAFTLSDGTSEKRTPIAIRVFLTYTLQANRAYFDDIQLIKEPAQSYTYDDDGNLISVVSNAEQKSNLEYNSNNKLTKYVDAKGYDYDYTYDDTTGALKTAKNNSGTTYTYAYESNGFCKESAAVSSAGNKILSTNTLTNDSTSNTYTVTSTDSLGYQTSATYNAKNGTLQSAKNARGKTITYSYNNSNDVLQSVAQEGSAVSYSHDSSFKKLLGITTSTSDYGFTYDAFGNRTKTTVGDHTLATYTYDVDSGVIQSMKYGDENGDGDKVSYTYDKYGNVRTEKLNGKTVYEGLADKTGAITKAIDSTNKLQYNYVYDSTGRLTSSTRTRTDTNTRVAMFEYDFDLNNNMTKFSALTPHGSNVTQYTYGADNLPATSTFSNGKKLSYVFDTVCLPKSVEINTTTPIKTEYTYFKLIGTDFNRLTDVVRTEKSGAFNYRYKYNKNYSITEILETVTDENNVSTESVIENYTYDALDQLTQAVDYKHNKKYVYTYDSSGNITEEKIYDISGSSEVLSKTNTYSYDDASWGDLLTAYNGQAITYDEIGNPLTYRDGITFSWSNGRRLDSYTKNGETVSYTYDTDGMRLTKTVDGKLHTYLYEGGLLVQETRGDEIFDYSYDANGSIRMLKYRATESATPTYYYYALNSRNDVVGLYNSSGAVCAKYTYDPWGDITSVTNASGTAITDTNNIAHTQPFRYRSYYYDTDSKFYYLQSRYYDPLTHRFINTDSVACGSGDSVQGYNLFAYCNNNPVNQSDPDGHWPKWMKKAVKWVVKNVVKPVVKKVQKSFSKTNVTCSRGINVSATPSAFSFNLQGGGSIDTKGNFALQYSYSGGVTGGNPSASLTAYESVSNAPSIYKLEGTSYQLGGTLGVPVYGVPLAAGGDFNIMPDTELNKTYYGLTTNFGFGTPGKELHVEWGNTVTLVSFNIFDEFDNAYNNIMRW